MQVPRFSQALLQYSTLEHSALKISYSTSVLNALEHRRCVCRLAQIDGPQGDSCVSLDDDTYAFTIYS